MAAPLPCPRVALPRQLDGLAVRQRPVGQPVTRLSGETMGTVWRLAAIVPASLQSRNGCHDAWLHEAVAARLAAIVGEMSHWQADSVLCSFNRAAAGEWVSLPPDFAHVMAAALALAEASDGAFSPALGRLVDLWGFGPPGPVAQEPADDAVRQTHRAADWRRLTFDATSARLRQPGGLALDLSAIAKGFAVDALAEGLTMAGIRHFAVEVGGEWRGAGTQPDGQPWWVALEVPPAMMLAPFHVALHGLAVATSGTYVRGGHNLDPRTGRPATSGTVSCSVLHPSAMMADGWASALLVLGAGEGLALAERLGLAARWVHADGTEHISPALAAMMADDSDSP